eukprot:4703825-Amphidinium_carterae.1
MPSIRHLVVQQRSTCAREAKVELLLNSSRGMNNSILNEQTRKRCVARSGSFGVGLQEGHATVSRDGSNRGHECHLLHQNLVLL